MMTDELTDNGILSDHSDVTVLSYLDLHGEPVHVDGDCLIFADRYAHELNEWAEAIGLGRSTLAKTMHELARERCDYSWATSDPVVIDAETFRRESDLDAISLLIRRGCSPAEALDWFATEDRHWSQSEWARWREVSQPAVSENVAKARKKLD